VRERPPLLDVSYVGFVDPSDGSDSMAMCIGHREGGVIIIDALRERRPPFSPDSIVDEFAIVLKSYRVSKVVGDRYAREWPRERFRVRGIAYEGIVTSSK
jgi:hypothetical protein